MPVNYCYHPSQKQPIKVIHFLPESRAILSVCFNCEKTVSTSKAIAGSESESAMERVVGDNRTIGSTEDLTI